MCVQDGMEAAAKRASYAYDVTYVTAEDASCDQLRDGLCLDPGDRVHRPSHFAIVVEARSSLVIAVEVATGGIGLDGVAGFVRGLVKGVDYDTNEYSQSCNLIEEGS